MKNFIIFFAISLVPLFIFMNVMQSFRFSSLKLEIVRLESAQREMIEKNKRSIAGISILESPERIDSLARGNYTSSDRRPRSSSSSSRGKM